jgi:hypothetical protein
MIKENVQLTIVLLVTQVPLFVWKDRGTEWQSLFLYPPLFLNILRIIRPVDMESHCDSEQEYKVHTCTKG